MVAKSIPHKSEGNFSENKKNLGPSGKIFSLIAGIVLFSTFFVVKELGMGGFVLMLFVHGCLHTFDYFSSEATKMNLNRLYKNGYTPTQIWPLLIYNFFSGMLLPALIVVWYSNEIKYYFDFLILVKLAFILACTDYVFYIVHKYLHQSLPNIHKIHHCARNSSFTTNLIFHPIDLNIEFSGPVMIVLFFSLLIFKDPFLMLLSFSSVLTWYLLDHDEYLKTPHWDHHKYMNSNYPVYMKWAVYDPEDKVRSIVQ